MRKSLRIAKKREQNEEQLFPTRKSVRIAKNKAQLFAEGIKYILYTDNAEEDVINSIDVAAEEPETEPDKSEVEIIPDKDEEIGKNDQWIWKGIKLIPTITLKDDDEDEDDEVICHGIAEHVKEKKEEKVIDLLTTNADEEETEKKEEEWPWVEAGKEEEEEVEDMVTFRHTYKKEVEEEEWPWAEAGQEEEEEVEDMETIDLVDEMRIYDEANI